MGRKLEIKPGNKFGRWTVIKEVEKKKWRRYFLCECSCEKKTRRDVILSGLKNETSKSCGCLKIEILSRMEDVIGRVYGRVTIISEYPKGKNDCRRIIGKCSCNGNIKDYNLYQLKSGHTTSCGCYQIEKLKNRRENAVGKIYGRITVVSDLDTNGRRRIVLGRCSCNGNIKGYRLSSLKRGITNSCGCYAKERIKESHTYRKKDYEEKYPFFCRIEEIMDDPNGYGILVQCKYCSEWFKPTTDQLWNRIKAVEDDLAAIENNFYCSDKCKTLCPLYRARKTRIRGEIDDNTPSKHELSIWSDEVFFRQFQEYGYNFCTKCQSIENLAAHHIDPKKTEPFFALDPENGIIFCRDCLLVTGITEYVALGSWLIRYAIKEIIK
ncbi:MAG: hypothetical protein WC055_00620 [Melioribacteraceae bacterium]